MLTFARLQEFCWVCMGPWSEHGTSWYNCARYEEKGDAGKNQDAQSKSRASLERYLHVSRPIPSICLTTDDDNE